jgi:hypothetical protein
MVFESVNATVGVQGLAGIETITGWGGVVFLIVGGAIALGIIIGSWKGLNKRIERFFEVIMKGLLLWAAGFVGLILSQIWNWLSYFSPEGKAPNFEFILWGILLIGLTFAAGVLVESLKIDKWIKKKVN